MTCFPGNLAHGARKHRLHIATDYFLFSCEDNGLSPCSKKHAHGSVVSPTKKSLDRGSPHLMSSTVKDARWYAWYDACVAWDRVWHTECMTHAFSWWLQGKSPWVLSASPESDESYSSRVYAWNAAGLEMG